MAKTKKEIIKDIDAHIRDRGGKYGDWYVGISNDAKRRLFNDHNVSEENGCWIYRTAPDDDTARDVEQHFLNKGCDGGGGGGDDDSTMVYAYKKTSSTEP